MRKSLVLAILITASFCCRAQMSSEYNDWIKKANAFFEAKQYQQAADAFTKAFGAGGGKGLVDDRYNAACAWAHTGNSDSAFFMLMRIATVANFSDLSHLTVDEDLTTLHNDKRWSELCVIVKQNKDKEEANLNKPLVAILDTVFEDDQSGRGGITAIQKKYGNDSKEMLDAWRTIEVRDSIDLVKVRKILDKYGWLGPDVVGRRGSQTIFLVIQHSDIKIQDKYLPMMRQAVKNKKAEPSDLALLEDRVAWRHGKKQIYGSQILSDAGGMFLCPIEDPDNVDKRRASVGLGPIADYVQYFGMTWNLEEHKKQMPQLEQRLKKMSAH